MAAPARLEDLPLAISPRQLTELIPSLGKLATYKIAGALGVRVERKIVIPRERLLAWLRGEVKITTERSRKQTGIEVPEPGNTHQ